MASIIKHMAAENPWLDRVAEKIAEVGEPIFGPDGSQAVKDVLWGKPIGHPLHPMMTDISVGAWTTSMIMDVLQEHHASDVALKIGTVSSVATALTGIAQYYDERDDTEIRRVGAAHASLNVAALACYLGAIALRENDQRAAGIATAWAGHTLASAAGWLGGHLTFGLGVGVKE